MVGSRLGGAPSQQMAKNLLHRCEDEKTHRIEFDNLQGEPKNQVSLMGCNNFQN